MEGWNPSIGCTLSCKCSYRGWVPDPKNYFTRRDPLIDAVRRTFSPCDRPARGPPLSEPVPSLKAPRELPVCCLEDYSEEKAEAKEREAAECCEKYRQSQNSLTPFVQVTNSCDRPICLTGPKGSGDKGRYVLVDKPVRTDILIGTFNPDDNKSAEELLRENCDRFWKPCSSGLRPYPCRGVIDFPRQQVIDTTLPTYHPEASICTGTKYVDPEYIQQQYTECLENESRKQMEQMAKKECQERAWKQRDAACYPPGCATRRCCE